MFTKSIYNSGSDSSKLLVRIKQDSPHEIYEPIVRKLGGVWNKTLNGWLFETIKEPQIDSFIDKNNNVFAENQNKEYYTKFAEEPSTYNTPSSTTSRQSNSGINEAFDLIQDLFDRLSDIEKIVEEHGRRLNARR